MIVRFGSPIISPLDILYCDLPPAPSIEMDEDNREKLNAFFQSVDGKDFDPAKTWHVDFDMYFGDGIVFKMRIDRFSERASSHRIQKRSSSFQ